MDSNKNEELLEANTNLVNAIKDLQERNNINNISVIDSEDYETQKLNLDSKISEIKEEIELYKRQIESYEDNIECMESNFLHLLKNCDKSKDEMTNFFIVNILPSIVKKENEKKKNKFLLEKLLLLLQEKGLNIGLSN